MNARFAFAAFAVLTLMAALVTRVPAGSAPAPDRRARELLARMTLEEKIGQMTQVENLSIKPDQVTARFIGSVLSGGDGAPPVNDPAAWARMVREYQDAARRTRLGIPILYGLDAVHGAGGIRGATVFPHNIGLGATRDPDLVRRIGRATAEEMAAVGIGWNFAPCLAVPQDIRWGRTYEGYAENPALVARLGAAYVRGLQDGSPRVASTLKHYIGDGGTTWGTSRTDDYRIDQGDLQTDEATLRRLFLPPYRAAVEAGAMTVMASFNSWNGVKLHGHKRLLTDLLKGELGFPGFVVSDWAGINQVSDDYDQAIAAAINAGIDMVMVPSQYPAFIDGLTRAVGSGRVPVSRIDDAVRRILRVKFELGLFDHPFPGSGFIPAVGEPAHRKLAREAVRRSLVLLKNQAHALPLARGRAAVYVAGPGADDIGMQCGGWTLVWQGKRGNEMGGTTILEGIRRSAAPARVEYDPEGDFPADRPAGAGIVVVGEPPYAEGQGDRADLSLPEADRARIARMGERFRPLVVIVLSGRPLVLTGIVSGAQAIVAAWLPGTEGAGVADLLFGGGDFTGKSPFTWPRRNDQLPIHTSAPAVSEADPLFSFGHGLSLTGPSGKAGKNGR